MQTPIIPIHTSGGQTFAHPAVVTVHLLDQSPGAALVAGVTLYFEPVGKAGTVGHGYPTRLTIGAKVIRLRLRDS